tara:strand:- start:770 stop:1111 length:342 start_codon:yes stop_codon:yes gene_type:complete
MVKGGICQDIRLICEYILLCILIYFSSKYLDVLIKCLSDGVEPSVDLYLRFSVECMIFTLLCSCCVLKWEYGIRNSIRIQDERQLKIIRDRELRIINSYDKKVCNIKYTNEIV